MFVHRPVSPNLSWNPNRTAYSTVPILYRTKVEVRIECDMLKNEYGSKYVRFGDKFGERGVFLCIFSLRKKCGETMNKVNT